MDRKMKGTPEQFREMSIEEIKKELAEIAERRAKTKPLWPDLMGTP